MSVPKSQRWAADGFRRTAGPFTLYARPYQLLHLAGFGEGWLWSIWRSDTKLMVLSGLKPQEKAAKLAAVRAVAKLMRGVR